MKNVSNIRRAILGDFFWTIANKFPEWYVPALWSFPDAIKCLVTLNGIQTQGSLLTNASCSWICCETKAILPKSKAYRSNLDPTGGGLVTEVTNEG